METQQPTTAVAAAPTNTALAPVKYELLDTSVSDSRDILMAKVLVMQPVSTLVAQEKAKQGELRDSLSGELLASKDEPLGFTPIYMFKTRITFKKIDGMQKFVGQVPWEMKYVGLPQTEIIGGIEFTHFETLNYYALISKNNYAFPYLLSFRSTGYMAGKSIESLKTMLQDLNPPRDALSKMFNLAVEQTKNDKGIFWKPKVTLNRDLTGEEYGQSVKWFKRIKSGETKVTVDDSDLERDVETVDAKADTSTMNTKF